MSDEKWTWSHEQHIRSDAAAGKKLIDRLLLKLEELSWGEQDIFGVHLAVEEAVVNAIKHGNRNNTEKWVHVICQVSSTSLRVEVTDQGDGFCPEDVPDPTEEDNLELPSGRGLMLMRSFMSTVRYNEKGNSVVMEKQSTNSH